MHLSPNQTYPWQLYLSDSELSVIQAVLRGDDLNEDEECLADRLGNTIDKIRPLAERTRERRRLRRANSNRNRDQDDGSSDDAEALGARRDRYSTSSSN